MRADQGPVYHRDADLSGDNVHAGGLMSPLGRPPTMKRAKVEPVQELVAKSGEDLIDANLPVDQLPAQSISLRTCTQADRRYSGRLPIRR